MSALNDSLNSLNSTASRISKFESKPEKRRVRAITRVRPFFSSDNKSSHQELESCVVPMPPNHIAFRQQKYADIIEQTFKL